MQIKIGQIYKVKPEFKNYCIRFNDTEEATYIRFVDNRHYNVLNQNKENTHEVCDCFEPEHLEPLEKTLYNLEVNDFVEDVGGNKRKVFGSIGNNSKNPLYFLSTHWDFESFDRIRSAKELEVNNYKIVQPEPTEEIKVEVTKQYMPEIERLKQITEKCFSDILKILDEYEKTK